MSTARSWSRRQAAHAAIVATILGVALALRLWQLDARVLHGDEAVSAQRVEDLARVGHDRELSRLLHGPTLPMLSLPVVRLSAPLVGDPEVTPYRLVSVLCGVGLVALTLLFAPVVGRRAAVLAAALTAVGPSQVFLSQYYVHEMLFALLGAAVLLALLRYLQQPCGARAAWVGLALGMQAATKETWPLVAGILAVALLLAGSVPRTGSAPTSPTRPRALHLLIGAAAWALTLVSVHTQLFTNPAGLAAIPAALATWVGQGLSGQRGELAQPWWYYLQRVFWYRDPLGAYPPFSELPLLALVLLSLRPAAGDDAAHRRARLLLQLYSLGLVAAFSAIPYKTPWNILTALHALALLGGLGADALLQRWSHGARRALAWGILAACTALMLAQALLLTTVHQHRPANPYSVAHTDPDIRRLIALTRRFADTLTDGDAMPLITVFARDQHVYPLPYYLRRFERRLRLEQVAGPLPAVPLIVTTARDLPAVRAATTAPYRIETFVLRPGVLVHALVRQDIHDALAREPATPP